jgi:NadR type nicotinamide-nucleotide adenylyltransferase
VARNSRPATGLVIGRFCPPHLGHSHLIESAAAQVETLVVFVNTRDDEPVPGELRARWLQELHPHVRVVEVRHDLRTNFDDPELWDAWMDLLGAHWPLDEGPDVIFSSEGYGGELARRFGADSIAVDPGRRTVPISATMIREAPLEHLHHLAPPVRAWVEAWARA